MRSFTASVVVVFSSLSVWSGCAPLEDEATTDSSNEASVAELGDLTVEDPGPALPDPLFVGSCVEQAKFGAVTGDEGWTQFWNDAGQNEDGARQACEMLGAADPATLRTVHDEWQQVEAFLEAAEEVTPPPSTPEPTSTTPTPAPVPERPTAFGTCAEAIAADGGNYRQGVDPQYDFYDDRDSDGVVCEN